MDTIKRHPDLSEGQGRLLADLTALPPSPDRDALAERVGAGEFDDFLSPHATPAVRLVAELTRCGFAELSRSAMEGRYDADLAASERWAASPGGRATAALLARSTR